MNKYHVNPESGDTGLCTASKVECPFGGKEFHFTNKEDARAFSEKLMESRYMEKNETKQGKLIVLVGVPGAGKSTAAAKLLEKYPDAFISNRDSLREELYGKEYQTHKPEQKKEAAVTAILRNNNNKRLREGGVVIDDNTNNNPWSIHALAENARKHGASIEVITLDVSVEEAKRRNAARGAAGGRLVPEHVIDRMAKKLYSEDGRVKDALVGLKQVVFVDKETEGMKRLAAYNEELEKKHPILGNDVAIVDIDGTLSFNHEALDRHLSVPAGTKKNWLGFYKDSEDAEVNQSVLNVVKQLRENGVTVFALTGRVDQYASSTIKFLEKADAPISRVIMGRQGDWRGDYYVKTSAVEAIEADGFKIVHSLDDRPSSIRVWEERNITVSRVPAHEVGEVLETYVMPEIDSLVGRGSCIVCSEKTSDGEIIHVLCRS